MSSFEAMNKIMLFSMAALGVALAVLMFAVWDISNETMARADACDDAGYNYVSQGLWAGTRDKPSTIKRDNIIYLRCVTLIDTNETQTMVDEWIIYGDWHG